jgi:hypothetical protein
VSETQVVIVAVPVDAVGELESGRLAFPVPVFRGSTLDALVTVGTDAAALVSLLQAPDAIHAFATWIRGRYKQPGDSIELSARCGDRRVYLKVDGHIDTSVVTDFINSALKGEDC